MKMTKMCYVVVMAMVCVTSVVTAGPVGMVLDDGPGEAVLFFVTHVGSLIDVELDPIIFNEVILNQGSAFDNRTGVFTVPVTGAYQLSFSAQSCRGEHNNRWNMMVNDERKIVCHSQISGRETVLSTCLYIEELTKGDRVWMVQKEGSCAWASATSRTINFSGVLLFSRERVTRLQQYVSRCPLVQGRGSALSRGAPSPLSLAPLLIGLFITCSELFIQ